MLPHQLMLWGQQGMSVELLKKCGLLVEMEIARSGGAGKQVAPKLVATDLPIGGLLKGDAHLRGKLLNVVEPIPDVRLRDSTPGDLRQLPGQRALTTNDLDSSLNSFPMISHGTQHDRDLCLMQQRYLLPDDKQLCHAYGTGMERWNTLASRLTWAMKEAGMDDKAVASELSRRLQRKVPWQTIQSIRRGKANSTIYIARLAQVLRCNAVWLDSGEEEPYSTGMPTGQLGELTHAAIEFARRWQALSPPLRSKVHDVLVAYEALAESETPEPAPKSRRPVTA